MIRLSALALLAAALAAPASAQTNGPKDTGSMAYPETKSRPVQAAPPANDTGSMQTPGHDGPPSRVTSTPPANDTGSMKTQDNGTAKVR